MGLVKGGFLRLLQTILYAICFCCAAVILGIYSYFLAVQADHHQYIQTWERAVEGLSGAAVLYTIFAVILTCCLGGVAFFSFLGLVLDLLFAGAMIAIAVMTRGGASSCNGYVYTPLGDGPSSDGAVGFDNGNGGVDVVYAASYHYACRLNTACFAVSIIGIIFFLITAFMQIALVRSHKKDQRFGPSPNNGYTAGAPKRSFWNRKSRKNNNLEKDAELGTTGTAVGGGLAAPSHHNNLRPSHDTGYTGTTTAGSAINNDKYETAPAAGAHGGYYTQPQGTGVNPYGYENNTHTTTTTSTNY